MIFPTTKILKKISHFIVFFLNYLLLSAKRIVSLYFMFQLYTMTTIPSGSIANYYCPLNHNSPIATPECKELGNSYCLDKPPFLVIPCLPAAVRNTHYFCPLLSIIFVAKTKITIWLNPQMDSALSCFLFKSFTGQ